MVFRIPRSGAPLLCCLIIFVAGAGTAGGAGAAPRQAKDPCGIPTTAPVWIDYAEGSVAPDVRALFAQPGVVVTASGTVIPRSFRDHGAATTYFELHLPTLVGQPSDPNDPASIDATADALFQRASVSTACAAPTIALNELFGESIKTPWSVSNATYRANVLELTKRLADRGAKPVLFVHGDPNTDGAAADWWRQIANVGSIVYELYFSGARLSELGPVLGARRVREGGRAFVAQFHGLGIPQSKLGIALGFHSARVAGIGGRQGLEPVEAWLRVVKWQAIAATQVAKDTGLGSIWSWGWALLGADDPDKLVTDCVYLWARPEALRRADQGWARVQRVASRGSDRAPGRRDLHVRPRNGRHGSRRRARRRPPRSARCPVRCLLQCRAADRGTGAVRGRGERRAGGGRPVPREAARLSRSPDPFVRDSPGGARRDPG
jgi:hypothetical protein